MKAILFTVAVTALFSSSCFTASGAIINEIRISSPGATDDVSNFIEIAGSPGESLDGLSLVVIDGEFTPGLVNSVTDLTGSVIPADGYFLAAAVSTEYPSQVDLVTGVDFFGSPSTFFLVEGFSGIVNQDYDLLDDGVLDQPLWNSVADAVTIADGDANTDVSYSGPIITVPGGSMFSPAHIERVPDFTGAFLTDAGKFLDRSGDTPGTANRLGIPEPSTAALVIVAFGLFGSSRGKATAG